MDNKETVVQESVYSEEGEITFKGLLGFLKRSWLRFVIYLAVALLVVTAVYGGVKFFGRSDYGVSSKIGFTFEELTKGHNPDGTNFDKEEIRSTSNIRAAVESAGLSDKILKGGNDIGDVRARVTAEAVVSQEYLQKFAALVAGGASQTDAALQLAQLDYKPTEFLVSFNDYEQLGLDKKEATAFLDRLVSEYANGYHGKYFKKEIISDSVFTMENTALYDYLDYVELCETEYEKISVYLDTVGDEEFKEASALKNELAFMQSRLMSFKSFVINGNVSKDIDKLKNATQTAKDNFTAEKGKLNELIESMKETLANIQPSTTTTFPGGGADAVITVTYPESYYKLQEKLISYQEQLANISAQLNKKNAIKTALESGNTPQDGDFVTADALMAEIKNISKTFIADVNKAVDEYAEKEISKSGMSVIMPSTYFSQSPAFPTLLAYVGAVLVAVAAAVIVTLALGSRGKKLKVKAGTEENKAEEESK